MLEHSPSRIEPGGVARETVPTSSRPRISSNRHRTAWSPRSRRHHSSFRAQAGSPSRRDARRVHRRSGERALCPIEPNPRGSSQTCPERDGITRAPRARALHIHPIEALHRVRVIQHVGSRAPIGGEGPLRRGRGARRRSGSREGEANLQPRISNPRRNVRSVCPSDDVLDRTTTAVARLPARGEARRARGFASQPLDWFALVGSSFGAREDTFEIAFGPLARAIFRRKHGVFRDTELLSERASSRAAHDPPDQESTKSVLVTSSRAGASASGEWIVSNRKCRASGNARKNRFALPGSFSNVATTCP